MPIARFQMPDGRVARFEVPEGTTPEQAQVMMGSHFGSPKEESNGWEDFKGGLASGPINAFIGVKQLLGQESDTDKAVLAMNEEAAKKAPASALLGNVAMLAPTAFIPGANTMAGASAIGAVAGLINPADSIKERVLNTAVGGVAGAGGQAIGSKLSQALTNRLGASNVAAQTANSLAKPKANTLAAGQGAGYVVPPSSVNPTFLTNRLEGVAGKAALKQESAIRNQEVTNALARKSVGVADDVPLGKSVLEGLRKEAGKTYEEVGNLSPIAKQDLEALKQARNDAQGWFAAYNRSASPADLAKAKEAKALSDMLEDSLETEAQQAGRAELIPALREARVKIAKTYTVERALNEATGDISAPVIGRLAAKGKPLSDELKTVGQFQQAFPQFMGEGAKQPAAGVSKVEGLVAALLAGGGAAATGSPLGLAAGGLALAGSPTRAALLSKTLQSRLAKVPTKDAGNTLKLAQALMKQKALQNAMPALTAQGVLSAESGF